MFLVLDPERLLLTNDMQLFPTPYTSVQDHNKHKLFRTQFCTSFRSKHPIKGSSLPFHSQSNSRQIDIESSFLALLIIYVQRNGFLFFVYASSIGTCTCGCPNGHIPFPHVQVRMRRWIFFLLALSYIIYIHTHIDLAGVIISRDMFSIQCQERKEK